MRTHLRLLRLTLRNALPRITITREGGSTIIIHTPGFNLIWLLRRNFKRTTCDQCGQPFHDILQGRTGGKGENLCGPCDAADNTVPI